MAAINSWDSCKRKQNRFPLGCDVDKERIFNYPYLTDAETIAFIKEHGHVMFIIRGPNSTLKATLSEMIMTQYPTAQHCCADHYFSKSFSPQSRNKETLSLSHAYCQKKVLTACQKNESPIIVQNTHIRKSEFQSYLDMAAEHNYTVIMAITLYKFNVTPKALERVNPDGLDVNYFKIRLRQWEDVTPLFTAWFLSPNTAAFVLKSFQMTLSTLLGDGKFCQVFDCYDNENIWNYFECRRNLYCIAGYTHDTYQMKKYYLSDLVQDCYGKSYIISILGYLISKTYVMALIHIDEEMSGLLYEKSDDGNSLVEEIAMMNVNDNMNKYAATVPFNQDDAPETSVMLEDWQDKDSVKDCKFVHVAQRKDKYFDIRVLKNKYKNVSSLSDDVQCHQLEDNLVYRLPEDEWFVKLPKKIKVKTIFTGLYV